MESSNPIHFADSERQLIWPSVSENSRDILVSIGTGYSSDYEGNPDQDTDDSKALKILEQMGIFSKIAILHLVNQNTSRCQRTWEDFQATLADEPHQMRRCHRVNVPYGRGQTLCKLDEISKMEATQSEAFSFLRQKSTSVSPDVQRRSFSKLDMIARQLTATLFYFQDLDAYDLNENKLHCRGLLYCRLSSACMEQMKSLINSGRPLFQVWQEEMPEGQKLEFGERGWNFNDFSISASFDAFAYAKKGVRIQVTFEGWNNAWEDISGFPRKIKQHGT
jgi:hypothetical protein